MAKRNEVEPEAVSDSTVVEYEEIETDDSQRQGIPLKFELLGDSVTGTYVKRGKTDEHGEFRSQVTYDIASEMTGKRYTVFGNSDLNSKMAKVRIGSRVVIEYINDEPVEGRPDYNPLKIFSVKVAKADKQAAPARGAARKL